jgi:hypothetical protein
MFPSQGKELQREIISVYFKLLRVLFHQQNQSFEGKRAFMNFKRCVCRNFHVWKEKPKVCQSMSFNNNEMKHTCSSNNKRYLANHGFRILISTHLKCS